MERADFIHMVRLSEQASADNSGAYRRSVALFAALGYLWVVGCFLLAITVLMWTISGMVHAGIAIHDVWPLLVGGSLLWTSLRALWWRLEAPTGVALTPSEAPALFAALERIRKKTKGPAIDHVLLDGSFNAGISQLPRYGLFGGATNYLSIGLPLLMAVDRPRFLAVLAHEYGHLQGGHGQFSAWIYRTRLSWAKLQRGMGNSSGPVAAATQAFLRWYFPRFLAKSFALARQNEFEADRIAGKLLGGDVAGAALTEIAVKGNWLDTKFWPLHWSAAASSAKPLGPYACMRTLLAQPVEQDFAREALRQSLVALSGEDDTHPVLRDRLEALDVSRQLPTWSTRAATDLLGDNYAKWLTHFDNQWCREHAQDWKHHHAYLKRVQTRIDLLTKSIRTNNAHEMTQLGDLQRRLTRDMDVRACYERALQLTPEHPGALRGLVNCLPQTEHPTRMAYLNTLFEVSMADKWWASHMAVQALEKAVALGTMDDKALKLWRERMKHADAAEERAWEELTDARFFYSITRHDLNDFEKDEFLSDMARCKPVTRAWLVSKTLKEFTYRRCYILFLELPGMADEDRFTLCRALEQTLDLPGRALVLWAGYSPTLAEIEKNTFGVTYGRGRS